jgi:acyl-CoA thioesterase-1
VRKLLSFVTVLLLLGCSSAPAPEAESAREREPAQQVSVPDDAPVIVAFGDSLTAGLGLAPEDSFPSLMQTLLVERGLVYRVANEGVSGDTTATALQRVDMAASQKPALTLVAIGANDGLRGLPVDEMEKNLREIIDRFEAAGSRVALAGMLVPPNMGPEYAEAFAAVYPRVAKDKDLPLMPFLLEGIAAEPDLNQDDGIHPNEAGARVLAREVTDFVAPLLGAD